MSTELTRRELDEDQERPSGVPGPHRLGEARREGLYVVLAVVLLVLISLGFWFEATH